MNSRLNVSDLLRVGSVGFRARRLRAVLSALGISLGIGSIVGILGVSASSQADLLAQLDRLGTNLLTVAPGQAVGGGNAVLPATAPGMIRRVGPVQQVAATGVISSVTVRRTDKIPSFLTGGVSVRASDITLLQTLGGRIRHGAFLNRATAKYPAAVLGASAADYLGLTNLRYHVQIYVGGQWFAVIGILDPLTLAPELDRSILIGYPAAETYLGFDGRYTAIYLRTDPDQVANVEAVLARTANPAHPEQVNVSRPSDVLAARAAAKGAYTALFIALGSVALLVGAVGIANVMFISVLERRSEIGLRRALGGTKLHIGLQFLTESLLLAAIGGSVGVLFGGIATAIYAVANQSPLVIPIVAVWTGLISALIVGALAGLYPALRAARQSPAEALRAV